MQSPSERSQLEGYIIHTRFIQSAQVSGSHCSKTSATISTVKSEPCCHPKKKLSTSQHSLLISPQPSAPGNHWSAFCLYRFVCSGHFIQMESYNIYNHIYLAFCILASFPKDDVLKFHPCCSGNQDFIHFYCWIIVQGINIAPLFLHWSLFPLLALMNWLNWLAIMNWWIVSTYGCYE